MGRPGAPLFCCMRRLEAQWQTAHRQLHLLRIESAAAVLRQRGRAVVRPYKTSWHTGLEGTDSSGLTVTYRLAALQSCRCATLRCQGSPTCKGAHRRLTVSHMGGMALLTVKKDRHQQRWTSGQTARPVRLTSSRYSRILEDAHPVDWHGCRLSSEILIPEGMSSSIPSVWECRRKSWLDERCRDVGVSTHRS
jgi:hypothetical protein